MRMKRTLTWSVALLTFVLLAGCATGPVKAKQRYFWPPPPDVPRVEWLGFYQNKTQLKQEGFMSEVLGDDNVISLGFPVFAAGDGMGRMYVSDHKLFGVMVFDFNTLTTHLLGSPKGNVNTTGILRPSGIAFDADGLLYVGDTEGKKVFVFDKNEKAIRVLDFTKTCKSIAFFSIDKLRKHLIIPDVQGHKIVITDLSGKVINSFGVRGGRDGDFNYPSATAVDSSGNILVCDQMNARVEVFTPDGVFKSKFGKRGDGVGEFSIIKGVAVDSEGHVYVSDGRGNKVTIFSEAGDLLLQVGYPFAEQSATSATPGGFNFPNGIFIDQNDTIYVADVLNLRVQVFQYLNEKYLKEHPVSNAAAPRLK